MSTWSQGKHAQCTETALELRIKPCSLALWGISPTSCVTMLCLIIFSYSIDHYETTMEWCVGWTFIAFFQWNTLFWRWTVIAAHQWTSHNKMEVNCQVNTQAGGAGIHWVILLRLVLQPRSWMRAITILCNKSKILWVFSLYMGGRSHMESNYGCWLLAGKW